MTVLDPELDKELAARLAELPKVVRDAIESADVEKLLRDLAQTHRLHLDQWRVLENEVMLTLLGLEAPNTLAANLAAEAKIPKEIASQLAADVSRMVFEPIRQELERQLEHPDAKEKAVTGVEAARAAEIEKAAPAETPPAPPSPQAPAPQRVQPATPPAPVPTERAVRVPPSGAYKPGEASSMRKNIHDDPYRESPT